MIDKCNEALKNSHIGNTEFKVMGLNEIPWKQEFNIIYSKLKSADEVYKHFLSVRLKLYVEVLPEELKKEFMDAVL